MIKSSVRQLEVEQQVVFNATTKSMIASCISARLGGKTNTIMGTEGCLHAHTNATHQLRQWKLKKEEQRCGDTGGTRANASAAWQSHTAGTDEENLTPTLTPTKNPNPNPNPSPNPNPNRRKKA